MLDINFVLNNLEMVETKYHQRGFIWDKSAFLEKAIQKKTMQKEVEELRNQANNIAMQIGKNKNDSLLINTLKKQGEDVKQALKEKEVIFNLLDKELENLALFLPNLPQDDVPIGMSDQDNVEIYQWGTPIQHQWHKEHDIIGAKLGMDAVAGAKLSGARFTVLRNHMARLHRALIQFMLQEHTNRGYEEVYVPYMVKADAMKGTGQLPKFAEDMFYIEKDDMYLIPTGEVPVTNLLADQLLEKVDFPVNFVAHTACFRREVGSAGRDTKGMIRQHQFDKVELVKFVLPEEAEREFINLITDAKNILEKLNLPYREVLLCTGDIGFGSTKTHDLEVWLPGQKAYREISSITNFQEFQARRMGLRYRDGKKKIIPYTINGSGLAVGRTLVAILENYQQEDGTVIIPEALKPWMGGVEKLEP